MRSMEVHYGVIRDKQGIHAGLLQSKSLNNQLAICYNSEGKLIVKICSVIDVVDGKDGKQAVLRSEPENAESELVVLLDHIQSIYPIRDFNK